LRTFPSKENFLDAICSYYAIIHVPREEHGRIIRSLWQLLKPNGLALLCLGAGDLLEDVSQYHDVPMFWSHYDDEANIKMITSAGFQVLWTKKVVDPTDTRSVHLFLLAVKANDRARSLP